MAPNNFDSQASTNYKEAFSLFDTRGVGRVVLDKLGDLLRACGQNPTLAEIHDLEKSIGGECKESWLVDLCSYGLLTSTFHSRLRDLPARPQPAGWLPRSWRARGILPRFPGV